MVHKQTTEPDPMRSAKCPECGSTRLLYSRGKLTCTNCGHTIGTKSNKYGAKKSIANDGMRRDSMFEASVANELLLRKKARDIKDYDSQYRVDIDLYDEKGRLCYTVRHKVDFRIHHNDGSFELYEAKGIETDDYKWRRKNLEHVWLPLHPDHTYTVVKEKKRGWR